MKVTRHLLQKEFDAELPDTPGIAEAFTFHAFEIEAVEGDMLDIKVLPNRGADCMSVRGIAKELSAILNLPLKGDILREAAPSFPATNALVVTADERYVVRHTGALLRGVTVGPSPAWLRETLESVGQRSINTVVDAMNYVMLAMGQPSGAFDVGKMQLDGDVLRIDIREARAGEKIKLLTGETAELTPGMFAFTDKTSGMLLDVAGIKGGLDSGITEKTTDIFLSVGNYDGTLLRRASQKLKLFTDAAQRYQNRPSPELTVYGMQFILSLCKEIGVGGELVGVHDVYPQRQNIASVSVTATQISDRLGMTYSDEDVAGVFARLDLPYTKNGDTFLVTPHFERTDLLLPEDLAEEVGRILGYDRVPATVLPEGVASDQSRFRGIERMKDQLIEQGFTEVSTQSFVKKGDVYLANPLDNTRPALRTSLEETLNDALEKAKTYAPLVMPNQKPKLFEAGTVFPEAGEYVELRMTETAWDGVPTHDNLSQAKLEDYGKEYAPKRYELGPYQPFSVYPFVLRDIALWKPDEVVMDAPDTQHEGVMQVIKKHAGPNLVRCDLFDRFKKDDKVSLAFHLVFQSDEKTLTDEEVNAAMAEVTAALQAIPEWKVR